MKTLRKTRHLPSAVEYTKSIDLGKSPRCWNDLTRSQLLFVCALFAKAKPISNFLCRVAMKVYDLRLIKSIPAGEEEFFLFRKKRQRIILSALQVDTLSRKLEWLTTESDLSVNKIPVIRVGLRKYYGPEDKLFNLTFNEYQSAENYYLAFNKLREVKYLDMLVATLYRPRIKNLRGELRKPSFNGDIREPFNDYLTQRRVKKVSRLNIAYKWVVFQFFSGSVCHLQKTYSLVFQELGGSPDSLSKVYQQTMLIEYLKGENINADPLKENVYQIMARFQRDRLRAQSLENIKKNV